VCHITVKTESMLLWQVICIAIRSAEQFRLQCTLECVQWWQWRARRRQLVPDFRSSNRECSVHNQKTGRLLGEVRKQAIIKRICEMAEFLAGSRKVKEWWMAAVVIIKTISCNVWDGAEGWKLNFKWPTEWKTCTCKWVVVTMDLSGFVLIQVAGHMTTAQQQACSSHSATLLEHRTPNEDSAFTYHDTTIAFSSDFRCMFERKTHCLAVVSVTNVNTTSACDTLICYLFLLSKFFSCMVL